MIALVTSNGQNLQELLKASKIEFQVFQNAETALGQTGPGDGILLLADHYPQTSLAVPEVVMSAVRNGERQVLVEFPESLPGFPEAETCSIKYERGVITSDEFAPALENGRIVMLHDCRYRTFDGKNPFLVLARVAGFDRIVYGLPEQVFPVLFEDYNQHLIVATTKLSDFITSRFAPADAWKQIWQVLLQKLAGKALPELVVKQQVHPLFPTTAVIGPEEEALVAKRGVEWFEKARLFVAPDWKDIPIGEKGHPDGIGPGPLSRGFSCGDGSLGMIEGINSGIFADGTQSYRYTVRADCMGEVSLSLALAGVSENVEIWKQRSHNLNQYIFYNSNFSGERRNDPDSASYGLISWCAYDDNNGIYYGDDNARMLLGSFGAAAVLKDNSFLYKAIRCLMANLRTTGPDGFRNERLEDDDMQEKSWQYFRTTSRTHFAPHFESYLWALYLAAYAGSGFKPFWHCAKTGIDNMMKAYPHDWKWTNGIQQERARMLLALSFLVRVADTPQHREYLNFMCSEILKYQDVQSGAIQEQVGTEGKGMFGPCSSNENYGTTEAPLIQENTDTLSDLLYTTNFAFMGLHEASAATGDERWKKAENQLAAALCRMQVCSDSHVDLDGAWFRAFDFRRHDYWGSNADAGWGVWSVESGWTQAWIASVLYLRQKKTSLWVLYGQLDWAAMVAKCAVELGFCLEKE